MRTRSGATLLTNAALLVCGLLIVEFCRVGVVEFQHYTFGIGTDIFAQLMLYLGSIALIERCPTDKWTLRTIFAIALLASLICVFHPAFLSTDVYRYVWDGKVQAAGINPFRYIPADGHLSFLRDSSIYPHINRRDYAHTIYPPGAQAIFLAVTRISASEPFMKLAMVGFEAVTCIVLMRLLTMLGLPRQRVLLYAWNPLCFWEVASSGHVDAAALTFITLALYFRLKEMPVQTGAWLGAAALVKLYPALLLPALIRRGEWRMAASLMGVIFFGYACYASVGAGVFGFLPMFAREEGLETGNRYFPLTFINRMLHTAIPPAAYVALCALLILAVCAWAMRRGSQPHAFIFSALVIATVLNLCYSPHYPWYFLWLLPFLTLVPWLPALYLVTASTFLFATQLGAAGAPMYLLNKLLYGGFFAMLAYDGLRRKLLARSANSEQPLHPARVTMLAETKEL